MILLSRIARRIHELRHETSKGDWKSNTNGLSEQIHFEIASKFAAAEVEKLWKRFGRLDAMLRSGEPRHVKGFLGPPTDYGFEELPPEMTADGVISAVLGLPMAMRLPKGKVHQGNDALDA